MSGKKKEIKFLDLQHHFVDNETRILETFKEICTKSCFVGGEFVERFENEFSNFLSNAKFNLDSKLLDIVIDPALAFGSGHHSSTFMCLELLSNLFDSKYKITSKDISKELNIKSGVESKLDFSKANMLDVGCGSGILSIAGAKLGAKIYACDTDELAIAESAKNAKLNGVEFKQLWRGSIDNMPKNAPKKYDIITANIIAFVINMLHNDFKSLLKKDGVLILSGILDKYKFDIIDTFCDFKPLCMLQRDEWIALKFTL